MEKLDGLPGTIILILDPARTTLERALGREDVPQDLQEELADICERMTAIIEQS
jgi:hypothetical protein